MSEAWPPSLIAIAWNLPPTANWPFQPFDFVQMAYLWYYKNLFLGNAHDYVVISFRRKLNSESFLYVCFLPLVLCCISLMTYVNSYTISSMFMMLKTRRFACSVEIYVNYDDNSIVNIF